MVLLHTNYIISLVVLEITLSIQISLLNYKIFRQYEQHKRETSVQREKVNVESQ